MFQTPKQQVTFIFISTVLAGFSLASILLFTDPKEAGLLTYSLLYVSLFLVVLGLFTILGLAIRAWFRPAIYVVNLGHSFRQAFLIAFLISLSLGLQAQDLLFWWVEASLILFFLALEVFLNLRL